MSEPTAIEKEAGKIVEGACASLEACPCGCNREATAGLFAEMPDEELLFDVADLFKAFSDTTRIKILFALMGGGLSVGDITAVVGCTQSAVSHQLRTLKQARLVKATRDGKNVIYALSDDHARPGHDPRVRVTLPPDSPNRPLLASGNNTERNHHAQVIQTGEP